MIEHSVLVHAHNQAAFITECIDSLFAQTVRPDEIVVYDAGSTDGTLALLRCYGGRLRLISGLSEGKPAHAADAQALEAAFARSLGRVVFLLNGADRFKPEKVARYLAAFEQHPDASVVQAPLERIDERGRPLGMMLEPRYHVTNHLREIYRRQDVDFFYPTSALAFSRYYLERILPLDLSDGLPLWTDARLCIPAAYYGRIVTLLDPYTDSRCPAAADTQRERSAPEWRQALIRARVFNAFCRRHKLRTISPWRNRRVYLHLLRRLLPSRLRPARGGVGSLLACLG